MKYSTYIYIYIYMYTTFLKDCVPPIDKYSLVGLRLSGHHTVHILGGNSTFYSILSKVSNTKVTNLKVLINIGIWREHPSLIRTEFNQRKGRISNSSFRPLGVNVPNVCIQNSSRFNSKELMSPCVKSRVQRCC